MQKAAASPSIAMRKEIKDAEGLRKADEQFSGSEQTRKQEPEL